MADGKTPSNISVVGNVSDHAAIFYYVLLQPRKRKRKYRIKSDGLLASYTLNGRTIKMSTRERLLVWHAMR